jgi:hypothetical protein
MEDNTYVRFECGNADRMSDEFGPFPYFQLTYLGIDVGDGTSIGYFDASAGMWVCVLDEQKYSDVIVYSGEEIAKGDGK